jgi:hypothetical protein
MRATILLWGASEDQKGDAAAKARRLAGEAIDRLVDKSAPMEEQAEQKHGLIKEPPEFRDMRANLPKATTR